MSPLDTLDTVLSKVKSILPRPSLEVIPWRMKKRSTMMLDEDFNMKLSIVILNSF